MDFKDFINKDKEELDEAILNNWRSHLTKDIKTKADNIKKRFK